MKSLPSISTLSRAALLVSIAVMAACGGSDKNPTGPGGSTYYLRFKANGTQVNFTAQASLYAAFAQAGAQYNMIGTGYTATSNSNIQVYNNSPVVVGTYSGYNINGGALVGALVGYQDDGGVSYTNQSATITISEITSTTVRGTFSGVVEANGHPDITITNGEFRLQRAN
jgi:hypothetical protein